MKKIYNKLFHKKSTNLDPYYIGYNYQHGIGVEKDELKAFGYYQKSAEMGNVNGIFQVGYCYDEGIGVEKDEHKAFVYYQKSADMGNAKGTYNVGNCYFNGIGVEKDEYKAFIYYQKSAEMGVTNGIYNVGYCYRNGIGVEKDEYNAFIYYQKSAEMGFAKGIFSVGYCYRNGIGVEKNERKAFIYYQKSADMGYTDGIYNVGCCYQNRIGVEKNEHKAFIYYQKSAEMGDTDGIFALGQYYNDGIGVEKDEHKAFIYYQKSAEMGNVNGIYTVGYYYRNGIGVEKDEYKAFIYYQKSAEMGHANGIFALGCCYKDGIGVEKDEHKAFIYYQKSAEIGNTSGTYMVGYCYSNGIGVEKDEYKAFIYYQKSAEMGHASGIKNVGYCYRNGIGVARDLQKANEWYQIERKQILANRQIYDNSDIDDDLKKILAESKYPLSWIPYNELEGIKTIGKGGFATVYYAMWHTREIRQPVALKLLHNSKEHKEEFIKELKAYCDIGDKNQTFLRCYGISKDNISKCYILVIQYAPRGSLRSNLHSISQMEWKNKLNLLHCIASDLQIIHSQEFIHRDLHSGNILQDDLYNAYIADLGHSISKNMALKAEHCRVYGILPYIAPEALDEGQYTTASDIYSFGIIMWEILYGRPVSYSQELGTRLQIEICCNDLRPTIIENTHQCYVSLMKECWKRELEHRPSAIKICEILTEWLNNELILSDLTKSDELLKNIKSTHAQPYSDNIYKSKLIEYTASLYGVSGLNELKIASDKI